MSRGSERLPALGLALEVMLLFSGAIFGRGVFFQRDIHWLWYPRVETFVRAVAEGAWPLWDPHSAFGQPALADPSYQIAYPFTWLNLVLLPSRVYKAFVIVHVLGAGLGLHCLARRWGLSRSSAFVAAAAWTASGPLVSCVSFFNHFAGLAWMPWVLLALDVALARGGSSPALVLGVLAAGQVLASGDMCFLTGLVGAAHTMVFILARPGSRFAVLASATRTCGIAALFALALSAVQWMPTAAILPAGSRLALGPAANLYWSLHPASLTDLVVPRLLSDLPMSEAVRAALFESREPPLPSVYLGMGVTLLAGLGALLGDRRTASFSVLSLLFFVSCALGRHAVLYPLLLKVPPFAMFRYPVKYIVPVSLFSALLAGLGMEAWQRPWSEREGLRAAVVASAALALALSALALAEWVRLRPAEIEGFLDAGANLASTVVKLRWAACVALLSALLLWIRRRHTLPDGRLTVALSALALGDLIMAGRDVNRLAAPELAAHRPGWIASLLADASPRRLFVVPIPGAARRRHAPEGWMPEWTWTLGVQELLAPPIGARWGLDGSYDGDIHGLAPPALSLLTQLLIQEQGKPLALRLLQMGSVDYVVALQEQPWLGQEALRAQSVFSDPIRVYRVPDPLPRAYVVDGVRAVLEPQSYAALMDPAFDARREVILAGGESRPPRPGFSGTARLLWRRADALAIEAELNGPGHLVVVEGFHSGWRARVDGASAEVLRANVLFRAVPLPAGRHVVELRYRPTWPALGAILSSCAALFGLSVWVSPLRERARHTGPRAAGG